MKARYHSPRVTVEPEGRNLRVSFRLENRSNETWDSSRGIHLGWQVFDPETGLFISEGKWTPLENPLAPGETAEQRVELLLPPERGRYHVYISPVEEGKGWSYASGSPFLLIEAAMGKGRAEFIGATSATVKSLRRRKRLRSLHRLFVDPVRTIWENRNLVRSMVKRDIAARYRGSFADVLWTVLNPALLMLTYFFVFGIVLRARFGGDPSRSGFALYFLAGMLPWLPFSEAVGRAPGIVLEYRTFVKKLLFPIEILPVNLTIAGLVTQFFALGVFAVFLLATRGTVPATALWLPVLIIPQLLFTVGFSWILAALGVYVRDLGQLIGYLLTLWFFVTPICYPEASLPAAAVPFLSKNPIFVLVRGFRDVLLEGRAPAFGPLWKLWVVSILIFLVGHAWFYKLRKSFVDVI